MKVRVAEALSHAVTTNQPARLSLPTTLNPDTLEPEDGARLLLEFTEGAPDSVGEITLSIEITDYAGTRYDDVIFEVRMAIPCLPASEWDVVPASGDHHDPCWFTLVDEEWIAKIRQEIQERGTEGFAMDPPDLTDGPDGFAHIVPRPSLTEAIIEGHAVRALCARTFVPANDPDSRPVCPDCASKQRDLDAALARPE